MKLFTIGFTKTTAERFFSRLKKNGVKKIADVRLNNVSQLSGFAKRDDLKFFARELCGIEYEYMPDLAPTKEMLNEYRKGNRDWNYYEKSFLKLMEKRHIENMDKSILDGACLLCSEDKPHYCHRRLVAEYLQRNWSDVDIIHL